MNWPFSGFPVHGVNQMAVNLFNKEEFSKIGFSVDINIWNQGNVTLLMSQEIGKERMAKSKVSIDQWES